MPRKIRCGVCPVGRRASTTATIAPPTGRYGSATRHQGGSGDSAVSSPPSLPAGGGHVVAAPISR